MAESRKVVNLLGAAGVALFALTGGALADGYTGSIKDAPAAPAREFTYSFGVTGTSDYVFRGQTQTDGDPTIQGTINVGYGIIYGGVWASGLDFGGGADGIGSDAEIEIDWYGGIKPTWGKATFDFGVIYYTYPGASDSILELDYVELKAGVSGEVFDKLTAGATVYYSPEYTGETGESWVFEGVLAYALPTIGIFTPTVSGTFGHADVEKLYDWNYWNAGVSLAVEKITLDFRYWDTDISSSENATCNSGGVFACDERFVFSVSVALP
jgi:uncharacterized protein (TIGR02001 family)